MSRLPGVNHLKAIKALEKFGYSIIRQSKHIIMSNGKTVLVIPRNNPLKPLTMGAILDAADISVEDFRKKL